MEKTNKILQMDLAISDSLSYFQNSIIEKQDSIIAITDKKYMETTALSVIYRNKSLITKNGTGETCIKWELVQHFWELS